MRITTRCLAMLTAVAGALCVAQTFFNGGVVGFAVRAGLGIVEEIAEVPRRAGEPVLGLGA